MQAVTLLDKSRAMGIIPNTIMYNTAMSSLGKSGQWEAAERLFGEVPEPDAVTYETLIAAYGMAGQANLAEIAFKYMLEAHHTPRDYAYCGLIAAHRCVSCHVPVSHAELFADLPRVFWAAIAHLGMLGVPMLGVPC